MSKHLRFRNRVFRLLSDEGTWMTAARIIEIFQCGGHPSLHIRDNHYCSPAMLPGNTTAVSNVLNRDRRFVSRTTKNKCTLGRNLCVVNGWTVKV